MESKLVQYLNFCILYYMVLHKFDFYMLLFLSNNNDMSLQQKKYALIIGAWYLTLRDILCNEL